MQTNILYHRLLELAQQEFQDIVQSTQLIGGTSLNPRVLRINFDDSSFLDVRFTNDDYAYHWERRGIDGAIYRWDNAPHHQSVKTFPHHLHAGAETTVSESSLPTNSAEDAFRFVLVFIRNYIYR